MDDERVAVKTYVPERQRERWREAADYLDMSLSEFVRTMVQAGRRDFDLDPAGTAGNDDSGPSNQGDTSLETTITDLLRTDEALSWDELVAAATEDVEGRIDEAVSALQDRNEIRYDGRNGGYVRVD
ncbi:hypothetical protein BRD17_04565 [Halobacteriales archaeon SW_7_68_16]|nr:MAG: hypothetical protein BRD17_04565 [Halobacteriales archaeon SW_7_68_16]